MLKIHNASIPDLGFAERGEKTLRGSNKKIALCHYIFLYMYYMYYMIIFKSTANFLHIHHSKTIIHSLIHSESIKDVEVIPSWNLSPCYRNICYIFLRCRCPSSSVSLSIFYTAMPSGQICLIKYHEYNLFW